MNTNDQNLGGEPGPDEVEDQVQGDDTDSDAGDDGDDGEGDGDDD
jgi:hypothetical protein